MSDAWVITCSDRAAAGEYTDRSGPILAEALRGWGFTVSSRIVPDGAPVGQALREACSGEARVVLTTGGTGLAPRDRTPEETAEVIDREAPGIPQTLREIGVAGGVPTAALSRGIAGIRGRTLIVNLPGSTGGVQDALPFLEAVLPHAIAQLDGSDH